MSSLRYRHELDGIRAIAVLAVILFHVGYPDMTGGFTGVDVFFVLSGYLICGQTYLRLIAGNYSATEFFARRIRRLSSAYFACFLVTALVANAFFLRSEMEVVANGFLSSITFTNNINLMSSAGYFSGPAHENPFLHTWSLSIEEQFYIALPMLILLTRRSPRVFAGLLVAFFALSLGFTLFSGDLVHDREARFFSSFFRVWELASGGLVFLALHHRLLPERLPLAPLAGLVLVLVPVSLLDASWLYPGWGTLMPVVGTLILIAFARPRDSRVARFLASRPMAYIGRISYGTYLWHWPLIVGVIYYGVHMSDEVRAVLLLISLGLGSLSYHLVEMPVRRIPVVARKRQLYALFAAQFTVLLAVAVYLLGQPGRADPGEDARLEALKAEIMNVHPDWDACWGGTGLDDFCRLGVPMAEGAAPDFLVWGDSMANSAFAAFDAYGRDHGEAGFLATAPACAPLAGAGFRVDCIDYNRKILAYLDRAPPMDVFLMARWSFYSEGYGNIGNTPGQKPLLRPDGTRPEDGFALFAQALEATIARVAARHRVIVINHVPDFPASVPKSMLRTLRFGSEPLRVARADFERRSGRAAAAVRRIAEAAGALHVAPYEWFCDADACNYQIDGAPLFIDNVHLGPLGNDMLRQAIEEVLEREGPQ